MARTASVVDGKLNLRGSPQVDKGKERKIEAYVEELENTWVQNVASEKQKKPCSVTYRA